MNLKAINDAKKIYTCADCNNKVKKLFTCCTTCTNKGEEFCFDCIDFVKAECNPKKPVITKAQLEKELLNIELLISSIDSPDRRAALKTKLLDIAGKL